MEKRRAQTNVSGMSGAILNPAILILRYVVGMGQAGDTFAMKKSGHSRLSHPVLVGWGETARR
jgi:hypothetical protein